MNTFVAPNGILYKESKVFIKAVHPVEGIKVAELWCDSYASNLKHDDEVLFPADFNCPFNVVDHIDQEDEFIRKGGGFRLDLNYRLTL